MKKKATRQAIPLAIIIGGVAIGAIVASGQSGKKQAVSSIEVNRERAAPPVVAVSLREAGRKPLAYYTGGVRNDLFSAPEPAKPKQPAKPEPKVETPPTLPPTPPVVVNPFADYAYAGTVNVGGRVLALIENTKTKDGQYLAEGDMFMGGKIASIGDRMLTVDVAGKQEIIAKRDDFKLTPLDKSAPFLQSAPAGGAPGAPGQPGNQPGQPQAGPGGPGGGAPWMRGMQGMPQNIQDRMRQRMESMTPEQRQRMEERMNNWRDRQFEGGGRRGGSGDRNRGGEGRRERRNNGG